MAAAIREQVTLDPSLNGFDHPDVDKMIHVAVDKAKRDFVRYRDVDEESLFTDIRGMVWRGWKNYDPTKRSPGSHAFQVAYRRLMDRKREVARLPHSAKQRDDDAPPGVERAVHAELSEEELIDAIEVMYATTKEYWDRPGFEQGPIGPGRPTLTWPQKAALTMLQRKMGWSCRDTEQYTKRFPGILIALGVTQSRSYRFFARASKAVTKFAKNQRRILEQQVAPTPAA